MEPACKDMARAKAGRWEWAEPVQGTSGRLCGQSRMNWGSTVQNEAGKEQEPDPGEPCHSWEGDQIFFYVQRDPFEGFKQRSDVS